MATWMAVTGAGAAAIASPHAASKPAGMAYKVQGDWRIEGLPHPLSAGDAVLPGSLVEPSGLASAHSLTVLLPDGQQLLYECFTPEDCARGFRVPALVDTPSRFAVEMLSRMRIHIAAQAASAPRANSAHESTGRTVAALDEAVVSWHGSPVVPVAGLFAALPDGQYTCVVQPPEAAAPQPPPLTLQKTGGTIMVPVPGAGLYDMLLSDPQGVQRVDMFVAVIDANHLSVLADYERAKKLLAGWNEKFSGWPEHLLLRAYLESWFQPAAPLRQ